VAHSMADSSVVPIDVGTGAREQASPPEAAGDSNKQPVQSSPETPKAVDHAVDAPQRKNAMRWLNDTSKMTWPTSAGGTAKRPACLRRALNYWLCLP